MNRKECQKILSMLYTAYPMYFDKVSRDKLPEMVSTYEKAFASADFNDVETATVSLIGKMKFCPSIAEIKEEMGCCGTAEIRVPDDYVLPANQKAMLEQIYSGTVPPDILEWERQTYYRVTHDNSPIRAEYMKGVAK